MTEAEWLACGDPQQMLPPFPARASVRKARLFAAACCRQFGSLLDPATTRQRDDMMATMEHRADVDPTETWADAVTGDADCASSYEEVEGCWKIAEFYFMIQHGGLMPCVRNLVSTAHAMGCHDADAEQAALLRCIVGNPFRPVAFDPAWRTSVVVDMARGIYDERAFDRLPILADALQEAGCDSADILDHCRGPGPHARGCWVIDLVLGKS